MSPSNATPLTDQGSETGRRARGRPLAASRADLLDAAGAVFDRAAPDEAARISMDTVAAAAGVGKATLFRTFGDRDGLLDALSSARFGPVRTALTDGATSRERVASATARTLAFLDAVLAFKLDNANILRAREASGRADLRSERYRWTHAFLRDLLRHAAPRIDDGSASLAAHVLLAALRIDLLDELLADGHTAAEIQRAQHDRTRDVIARARRRR